MKKASKSNKPESVVKSVPVFLIGVLNTDGVNIIMQFIYQGDSETDYYQTFNEFVSRFYENTNPKPKNVSFTGSHVLCDGKILALDSVITLGGDL